MTAQGISRSDLSAILADARKINMVERTRAELISAAAANSASFGLLLAQKAHPCIPPQCCQPSTRPRSSYACALCTGSTVSLVSLLAADCAGSLCDWSTCTAIMATFPVRNQ